MRNIIVLAFILGSALGASHLRAGLSPLEALAMLETGNDDDAVGTLGEISRYQIRPHVWRSYTASWNYRNPRQASLVAALHLDFLESNFKRRSGREPSDFDRYVLWNGGLAFYARLEFAPERVPPVVRERANRYVNLRHAAHHHGASP